MEITEIKQRINIIDLANHFGIVTDKNQRAICPFHNDKNPSLQFSQEKQIATCFSSNCNLGTVDIIGLTEKKLKINTHEALKYLTKFIGESSIVKAKSSVFQKVEAKAEPILTKIFSYFQNGLKSGLTKKPKEYLQSRNLDFTKLEIGYNSGQFHHRGKLNETDFKACISAGLLNAYKGKTPNAKESYTAFAKDCIIFPLKNKKGEIVSLYGRSIINNNKSKHFYLKNRTGLYPNYPPAETKKLILTESIIDAATLRQAQGRLLQEFEILALYGTNGLTPEHTEAVSQLKNLEEIIFFFDGDEAGRTAAEKYSLIFKTEFRNLIISNVAVPQNEDINSLLDGHEAEIFTHLLENRLPLSEVEGKPFSFSNESRKPTANHQINNLSEEPKAKSQKPVAKSQLNTNNPDYITYNTENLHFTLLGGINLQQLDRLRVTLKVTYNQQSIRHTLDLYHTDYTEKFIQKAAEKLEIGSSILSRTIDELTEKVEQYRLSKIESQKVQKIQKRELTEARKKKAIKYLSAPKLLWRTNQDIGRTGVIGEETNRLLMYLIFTSRLREQPLHIISLGGSGTGKTYLQEKISELIPEHDKKEITILSENAFYYFERTELKHKLVLIEDMDGAQEVLYPLRELQSKKKISKTVPIKDQKGNLKTVTLHVEGPICLAGTTTKERLYEDNANRSLLIYLDNSSEHKEEIMEYQRKLSADKINIKKENELKELFKDMQTVLKPIKVRNPYAEMLKIPEHVFKPLRTNAHYLAFIETITFYHQYQREVKTNTETGERYIETTIEDIEAANKLLKDVLLTKADELPRQIRDFFERIKNHLIINKKESFYTKEIREIFRITSSSCNRYVLELLRNNYIRISGGNKYRKGYEYEIVKQSEYVELQQHIKTALDKALENIKESVSQYPTVSQKTNGILKNNKINKLKPVSQ